MWEIKQRVLVDMAADRGAFIDQSQSFNVHMSDPNFGKLTSLHFYAWKARSPSTKPLLLLYFQSPQMQECVMLPSLTTPQLLSVGLIHACMEVRSRYTEVYFRPCWCCGLWPRHLFVTRLFTLSDGSSHPLH